jgi:hypothetical protein
VITPLEIVEQMVTRLSLSLSKSDFLMAVVMQQLVTIANQHPKWISHHSLREKFIEMAKQKMHPALKKNISFTPSNFAYLKGMYNCPCIPIDLSYLNLYSPVIAAH